MKKAIFGITLITLLFSLAACSKKTASPATAKGTDALTPEAELVVGTLKLENTSLAITAAQAKQLLPLWETLQTLTSSSTSATEEINALLDQIKGVMTKQQVDQITSLKLTQQDMLTAMADAGVGFGGASGTPNATPQANQQFFTSDPGAGGGKSFSSGGPSGSPSGSGPSGAMPGGQPPAGGVVVIQNDPGGAGGPMSGQSATPQAVRGNGFSSQVPPPLLNALIQLLQKKVG